MFGKNNVQKNFKKQMKEIEKDLKSKEKQDEGALSNNLFKLRFYGYTHGNRKVRFGKMFSGGIFSIIGIIFVIRIILSIVSSFMYQPYLGSDLINSYYDGDYSQSIMYSDKLLKKDQYNYSALLYKAKSLRALEKYEEAIGCLKKLESTSIDDNPEVLKEYGNCYADLAKHEDAINYYERAMEINSYDDIVAAALGWEYYYIGKYERATAYAQKAFTLNNDNRDAKRLINELEKVSAEDKNNTDVTS